MKFTQTRETLLDALQAVLGAIEKRHTSPILENVLIQVKDQQIFWRGTDLELEVVTTIPTIDATIGEITIPARKLFDICKSLPTESLITIEVDETKRARITSGRSRFELATLPAIDYPDLEDIGTTCQLSLPENVLKQMFDQVSFAMANQDVRYYLNGMLFEISTQHVRTVSTDGHRLSLCTHSQNNQIDELLQVIIPRKSVLELSKLLRADSQIDLTLQLTINHLRVQVDELRFTTKLVDGRYPDYNAAVPPQGQFSIEVDRKELKEVLTRVAILSNEKFRGVHLKMENNALEVHSNNPAQETAHDEIDIHYQGEEFSIGFNVNYLLDAINHLNNETLCLHFNSPDSSALITDPSDESIRNVVMPIRL